MMDQAQNLRNLVEQRRREKFDRQESRELVYENEVRRDIKIYTITSGKGGVGKTNFTVNTAIALQKRGKRVLIIDADLGMANVDILIGVFPKVTLYDVLFKEKPLSEAIINGPGGVRILPGGSGILKMTELEGRQIDRIAEDFLQLQDVDVILIDTGAGISKNLMSFVTFSKETIIVTTPEPTAMTDAYGMIKTISDIGLKKNLKVVVNRAVSKNMAVSTFERLRATVDSFLNITLEDLGYILDDSRVSNAVMERKAFVLQYPGAVASKCIEQIVDRMMEQESKAVKKVTTISEVYNRLIKVFG